MSCDKLEPKRVTALQCLLDKKTSCNESAKSTLRLTQAGEGRSRALFS